MNTTAVLLVLTAALAPLMSVTSLPAHAQAVRTSYIMYVGQDSVGVETVSLAKTAEGEEVYKSKIEADMSGTKVSSTARTVVSGDGLVVQGIDVNGDITRAGQTTPVRVIGKRDGDSLAIEATMGGQSMNMTIEMPEDAIISNRFMCQHASIFLRRLERSGWFDDPSSSRTFPVAELGPPHATEIEVKPGVTAATGQLNGADVETLSFVVGIDDVELDFTVSAADRSYLRVHQSTGGLTIVREGYGPVFVDENDDDDETEETPKRRRRR